jgi:hypothetical protein
MKSKDELLKVLCTIEKEIKYAKKFCEKQELTITQEIECRYHLAEIQDLSKKIKNLLES